jgi:sporulation protein YlmC with PRC-barrel domain
MSETIRLTDLVGRRVVDADGRRLGRVADLGVDHGERYPRVVAISVRNHRRVEVYPWAAVVSYDARRLVVAGDSAEAPGVDLHLVRDVLDAQVVDITGRRLARVGDIDLASHESVLRAIAVEVGVAPVLRRLGLRRLARRLPSESIAWDELHLASGPGHLVQLASPCAAVHRLGPGALMEVVSRLPPERGAQVLAAVPTERAERARELPGPMPRRRFSVMRVRKRAPR